uniref:Uncharacterized protein n=1 Tax=Arundo donax TaxID=35708 RepID=A0A0A9EHP5_ARUDO
MAASRMRRTG